MRSPSVGLLTVLAVCGCAPVAARYQGEVESARQPAAVAFVDHQTADMKRLGRVRVECQRPSSARPDGSVRLSELLCSPRLLAEAAREKAAAVGGDVVVGFECDGRAAVGLSCLGEVARGARARCAPDRGQEPLMAAGPAPGHASEAWRVRVKLAPVTDPPARMAHAGSEVRHVSTLPLSHIPVGEMIAECDTGCARDTVENALFAMAAHAGADAVAETRCTVDADRTACIGTAAAPEYDPRVVVDAR